LLTHVDGLALEPVQQIKHFLLYGLLMALLFELFLVLVFYQVDDLLVLVDVLSSPLIEVFDDALELRSNFL
jgi:hypothetical protein